MRVLSINGYDMSCGVRTISNTSMGTLTGEILINDLNELADIAFLHTDDDEDHHERAAFYLGSDTEGGSTENFFKELAFLGTVTKSPTRKNPNTGNRICIWTWMPSQKKLKTFLAFDKHGLPSKLMK